MRVLVLVIVSFDKPEYHDMLAVWRERINGGSDVCRSDVWFIQCKSDKEWIGDIVNDLREPLRSSLRAPLCLRPDGCMNPPLFLEHSQSLSLGSHSQSLSQSLSLGSLSQSLSLKDRFELDVANKTLYVRGDECLIPGILHKTVEALSFFLREAASLEPSFESMGFKGVSYAEYDEFPYDYVWRTNLSSVLDFAGLERFISSSKALDVGTNSLYAGYIGLGSLNNGSPTFFASGAGFLMSRDVAMYLVSNRDYLRWDIIDDVAIGALLEPRFGLMHLERCWVQSEHIVAEKDVFHFRCESYQHLRTVEFMRLASRFLEVDRVPQVPQVMIYICIYI